MTESSDVWHSRRALMLVVLCLTMLGVLGMAVTAFYVVDQRQYNSCQRSYNEANTRAIRERAEAGALDREAIRTISSSTFAMIEILLMPGSTQEQRVAAIKSWRDAQSRANLALANADDQRRQHPLPQSVEC